MTDEQREKCRLIIHGAAVAAAAPGAGLAQLPLADSAVIAPIQVGMIIALGRVFDIEVTQGVAKGMALSGAATLVGRAASQILVGWIPFLGNVINASTAIGITEAIGWTAANEFNRTVAEGKRIEPTESDFSDRLSEVTARATQAFGDTEKARHWLQNDVPSLGGQKPIDLLQTENGMREVLSAIDRIEYGGVA